MKLSGNTILITGGNSGIGLELAAEFIARGNTVILTGRDPAKLAAARLRLPAAHVITSDVADPDAIRALYQRVTKDFPELNVLINNAGIMRKINLHQDRDLADVTREIETNLMGPVRMTAQFLPHLKSRPHAVIVNVTSALAYVPLSITPVYSATKAGLHSYTQALRQQLKHTNVRVVELAPPGVATPLLDGFSVNDLGGAKGMDVGQLARAAIKGLGSGVDEIRPGLSRALHYLARLAPDLAVKQLGRSVDTMLKPEV
jgi:uncharacterized oxidoreductase